VRSLRVLDGTGGVALGQAGVRERWKTKGPFALNRKRPVSLTGI